MLPAEKEHLSGRKRCRAGSWPPCNTGEQASRGGMTAAAVLGWVAAGHALNTGGASAPCPGEHAGPQASQPARTCGGITSSSAS